MRKIEIALLLGLTYSSADAALVTYDFQGLVTSATGIFAGQGTGVNGTISVDDDLQDSLDNFDLVDNFNNNHLPNQALTSTYHSTLSLGSIFVSERGIDPETRNAQLFISDGVAGSLSDGTTFRDGDIVNFFIGGGAGVPGQSNFGFVATDVDGIGVAPGKGNLSNTIQGAFDVLDSLNLALFEIASGGWEERNSSNEILGFVEFDLIDFRRASVVPIPAALPLLLSALLLTAAFATKRPAIRFSL